MLDNGRYLALEQVLAKGKPMSHHTFCCEVCGHEHPNTGSYDDVTCEKCGREHIYDEGIHLAINDADRQVLLQADKKGKR